MGRSAEQKQESRAVAERIVETIVETVHEEQTLGGIEAASDLMEYTLEEMVSTIVNSALRHSDTIPNISKEEKLRLTTANLIEAKALIMEAVAEGFTQAYLHFCGQQTEHVCEIRMVDDGLSEGALS
jgi:hypothetical protein